MKRNPFNVKHSVVKVKPLKRVTQTSVKFSNFGRAQKARATTRSKNSGY